MTRLVLMPARVTPEIGLAPGCPREALISEPSRNNVSVVRFIRIAWRQWTGLHLNTPSRRKQATNSWRGTAKPPVGLASRGSVDESKYFMLSGALVYVRVLAMRKLLMALEDFGRGIDNQRMVAWWG